jgi:L-ribulose-5-phosphate 3-epimerase
MNSIGFMQGRLSPPRGGLIQSFPVETWRQEFARAGQAGLDCVEWIYELPTAEANPIRTAGGRREMRDLSETSEIAIWSVCADYFMTDLLLDAAGGARPQPGAELDQLLAWAAEIGCRYVLLPFVDASRLDPVQEAALPGVLAPHLALAADLGIELHLENDQTPARLATTIGNPAMGINLDTGNSASLGHDPSFEMAQIAPRLRSVHVKDRKKAGATVPLGSGDADLEAYFRLLMKVPYQGAFILQTARGKPGAEVEWCLANRNFVRSLMGRTSQATR